jgi:HEAT repeat protein
MKGSAYEAVPDLVKVIKANKSQCLNDALNICRYAAQALGNIGPAAKDAIPDLISLLDHQNPYVRIYAAVALIRIQPKNQEALNSISSLLKDQNVDVRRYTLWRLEDIGKEARPAKNVVKASMSDSDEEVRNTASKILKALREP